MIPVPCPLFSSDHTYELPLRRNLLLDLIDLLRFFAGVLLDRLGVAPCHGDVRLPGGDSWAGVLLDAAAAESVLGAPLWPSSSSRVGSSRPRTTAPLYMRRSPPAVDRGAVEDDDEGAAVCAICLAGLEAGGVCQVVAELCGCSHAFHAVCIDAWVRSGEAATCPLCRAPVTPTCPGD
jgi:hypothetical protein